MLNSDAALWSLAKAIVARDAGMLSRFLAASPELAKESFQAGATRQSAQPYYIDQIGRYVFAGHTALHIAAASYQTELVRMLIVAGADVFARNRLGYQPLHEAAVRSPGFRTWNPSSQAATILCLVEAGADPNATDKRGVAPLHRAVRTCCAAAVQAPLECGADPLLKTKSGGTPMLLALRNTGRGGTGSAEAKREQQEIIGLLKQSLSAPSRAKK